METLSSGTLGTPTYFYTLTYDDDHVPKTEAGHQTLRKRQFQKWLDAQRKAFPALRYYAVGEYGDKSFRPHYHLAVFCLSHRENDQFADKWPYGFVSRAEMSVERAGYLAKYAAKKLHKADDPRLKADMEPEYRASSKNPPLGESFVDALAATYRTDAGRSVLERFGDVVPQVQIAGRIYPLDGYMLTKLRSRLSIPEKHHARLANEAYFVRSIDRQLDNEERLEECTHEMARLMEAKINAKKKLSASITTTV